MSGVQRMTRRTQLAQKARDRGAASHLGIVRESKGRRDSFVIDFVENGGAAMTSRTKLLLTAAVIIVSRLPHASGQTITEFPLPAGTRPFDITAGPDGNLWFTDVRDNAIGIGRITTAGGVTEFSIAPHPDLVLPSGAIAAGPDGNLWIAITDFDGFGLIGRITPAGTYSEFQLPQSWGADDIIAGPDGNLWFTAEGNSIGRITTSGAVTQFSIPTAQSGQFGIAAGPDQNLWFTEYFGNRIGRITVAGVITEFPIPTASSQPSAITAGPDGNL